MSTAQCWHYSCFCYLKRHCFTYFSELLRIPSAATTTVLLTFVAFFVPPPATSHFCNGAKFKKKLVIPLFPSHACANAHVQTTAALAADLHSQAEVCHWFQETPTCLTFVYLVLQASKLVCVSMLLNITLMGLLV